MNGDIREEECHRGAEQEIDRDSPDQEPQRSTHSELVIRKVEAFGSP
jgi:hypothetical protein